MPGGRVVRCWTCDGEVVGSNPARGCVPPGSVQPLIRQPRPKYTNCRPVSLILDSFYPRDGMLARVIGIATCLYVTRRYYVKKKKASVMISSPSGSPMILDFWSQISSPNSKGFPRTEASKKGGVRKFSDFPALSVNISKTIADMAKVTISD